MKIHPASAKARYITKRQSSQYVYFFYHPDFNCRFLSFTESVPSTRESRTITAGRELHPAPKKFSGKSESFCRNNRYDFIGFFDFKSNLYVVQIKKGGVELRPKKIIFYTDLNSYLCMMFNASTAAMVPSATAVVT